VAARNLRRLLVPVAANAESLRAVDVACRLAADTRALVELVAVIEVPTLLPLDAQMADEEARTRTLLRRADAVAGSYGVNVTSRLLRAREASTAIVAEAAAAETQLMVIGAPRRRRAHRNAPVFGSTVRHALKHAPCRVMLIAAAEPVATNGHVAAGRVALPA
jgi:nucleotide-binding universal stress UspA family protein